MADSGDLSDAIWRSGTSAAIFSGSKCLEFVDERACDLRKRSSDSVGNGDFPVLLEFRKLVSQSALLGRCDFGLLNRAGKFVNVLFKAFDQRSKTACGVSLLLELTTPSPYRVDV
jgi:hypothetical protein